MSEELIEFSEMVDEHFDLYIPEQNAGWLDLFVGMFI